MGKDLILLQVFISKRDITFKHANHVLNLFTATTFSLSYRSTFFATFNTCTCVYKDGALRDGPFQNTFARQD